MEALNHGLFVIGYSNNGHEYVLKNTRNIICKKNTPKNLVIAIENYLKLNNDIIKNIRKQSYKKVKEYDSKIVSFSILNILESF